MPVENNGKIVTLTTESGSSAEIYLFGATVTSWKQGGKERLFLSNKSSLDSSKPVSSDGIAEIRGGIPICYPVFGAPPSEPAEYASLPSHGYARSHDWTLDSTVMDRPEGVSVRFKAPAPPAGFDHKHDLTYVVTLTAHQLSTDLHVTNTGTEDFKFQALLHNYLAVPDASKLMVEGLQKGQMWKDKTEGFKEKEWPGGPLKITKEQDGVFAKLPNNDLKLNYGDGTGVNVHFKGFEDCTIWNPQEATGSKMADLEDKGWERYVCIEPGFVSEFKTLKPEERFIGQQVLSTF